MTQRKRVAIARATGSRIGAARCFAGKEQTDPADTLATRISRTATMTASRPDMKTLSITQMAGMLPTDPKFREWVGTFVDGASVTADFAVAFIREVCQISSRKELATNRVAQRRFHHLLARPFNEWRGKQT